MLPGPRRRARVCVLRAGRHLHAQLGLPRHDGLGPVPRSLEREMLQRFGRRRRRWRRRRLQPVAYKASYAVARGHPTPNKMADAAACC